MKHASSEIISGYGTRNDNRARTYALPGILLCLAAFVMLAADVLLPGMTDRQYVMYPVICRSIMVVSTAVMLFQAVSSRADFMHRTDLTDIFFAGFVLLMLVSTCINGFTREALFSVPYRYVGVVDIIVYIAVYMGCSRRMYSERLRNGFLICYMLVADLVCGVFFFDWFVKDIPAIGSENPASAIFFHDNHYAYYLVIAIVISVGYFIYGTVPEMTVGLVSMLANLLALGINRTAGGFLAVGVTIVFMIVYTLIKRRECFRRALILTAAYLFGVLFLIIVSKSLRLEVIYIFKEAMVVLRGGDTTYIGHGRWTLWEITLGYLADAPLFGYGCEGLSETLYDYLGIANPHNEPLTYAVSFGIPAAVLYVAGCISAVRKGLRCDKDDDSRMIAGFAAMGYLLSSVFGVAMFYTAPYFFILMGLSAAYNEA